jgi:folate-binding protein YgfZ
MFEDYKKIREENAPAFYQQKRGLLSVWGKEAVQFLNGLITNDAAKLEEGAQMTAAFPNVQGRLVAMVRVLKQGEKFLFETDETTHEKVFQNLHRFTFAGDFFVEDLSEQYSYFEVINSDIGFPKSEIITFSGKMSQDFFVPADFAVSFENDLKEEGAVKITGGLYETLRIENGVPRYGVDMDETTVVLETGIDEAVSFTKGCYIGQEIIARIHFRGHVAKKLTGLILDSPLSAGERATASADGMVLSESESALTSPEGKPAGRITSITFSPKLQKTIALAYVRYEFLAEETLLKVGDISAKVAKFPVI